MSEHAFGQGVGGDAKVVHVLVDGEVRQVVYGA